MPWPSMSADLQPQETVWALCAARVRARIANSRKWREGAGRGAEDRQAWAQFVVAACKSIPASTKRRLGSNEHMRGRVQACIALEGGKVPGK